MTRVLVAILSLALGGVLSMDSAQAARAAKKTPVTKKAPAVKKAAAPKKAAANKPAKPAVKKVSKKPVRRARSRRRGARRVAFVPRQAQPTKERMVEIQQALIEKGYYTGEPTGVWGNDSMEALKRFQDDQSLKASGKVNSLSLIALGLGPKHNGLGALPVMAPAVAGPPEADPDAEPAEELEPPPTPGLEVTAPAGR